jgi:subtilisin-like proprotein convertase family protein
VKGKKVFRGIHAIELKAISALSGRIIMSTSFGNTWNMKKWQVVYYQYNYIRLMKKLYKVLTALFLLISNIMCGQDFVSTVDQPVPDDGEIYSFDLEVTGLPDSIDLTFGLERVCIAFDHPYVQDIQIWLEAPDGTLVDLSIDNGGGGQNYNATCFTENAWMSVTQGSAPYDGNFNPEGNLNDMNNGQDPNGIWTLHFFDTYFFADSGYLFDWGLSFTDEVINPEVNPFNFESSNLPLIYIDTENQGIPDEPGVLAFMQIIDNGEGNLNATTDPYTYEGWIDIETRGQSTQGFPKKSYGLEMRDENNNELDTAMLGFPAEEDWILYAPYSEKSLLQNWLAMTLGQGMSGYHSRVRYCEVILDGMYQGVYLLMEKIKKGNDRVDIATLNTDENTGDDLTGGYIWRLDWGGDTGWSSEFPTPADANTFPYFQFVYPNPDSVSEPQQEYLKAYVDSFEYALASPDFMLDGKRYDEFIDMNSFIETFIINEFTKNVDGYRLSSYFYKDKNSNNPLIISGPQWDFNLSFGNADYCDGADTDDWNYNNCGTMAEFWWPRFLEDEVYAQAVYCRWTELRQTLFTEENLHGMIDSMALHLSIAQDRNFVRWPILGVYVWPNGQVPSTYAEAIEQLKEWISERLIWLDENITGEPLCVPDLINNGPNLEIFEWQTSPPACWTTESALGSNTAWQGSLPVSGYQSEYSTFSDSFTGDVDNYLITPMLAPVSGEHLTYYITSSLLGAERFQVLLSTTGNELTDFTTVLWDEEISGGEWQYRANDLQNWWGQSIYIAFRHFDSPDGFQLKLDAVRIPSFSNPDDACFVSVGEVEPQNSAYVYPNPAHDVIFVKAINGMKIYNATGALVFESRESIHQIDVSDWSAGIYWIWSTTGVGRFAKE